MIEADMNRVKNILRKMNESVVTVSSLMKAMTRKKCWNKRENWHQQDRREIWRAEVGLLRVGNIWEGFERPQSHYSLVSPF